MKSGTCKSGSVLSDPRLEVIDWRQALDWWPSRPLLSFGAGPSGRPGQEVVIASSWEGGRKARADADGSILHVIYQYPPHTVETDSMLELIQDWAAIEMNLQYTRPPNEIVDPDFPPKRVLIRGNPGHMLVTYRERREGDEKAPWVGHGNYDRRSFYWQEPGEPRVWYRVNFNSRTYSEARSLDILNAMQPVG